jgi:cystathionine gamma-synthase
MAARDDRRGDSTRSVHAGEPAVREQRSITEPVVYSSTYPFADTAELIASFTGEIERTPEYGRYGNPTIAAIERRLAALEDAREAVLMSSGMAAITVTLLAMIRAGQHLVFTRDVYRKTRGFATQVLPRFGVETSVVEPTADAIEAALRPNTKIIFTEFPTNPYLRVPDVERIVEVAKRGRVKTIVDTTFATPLNVRPLDLGVDLVIHSGTKYLGGHNDLLAGVVMGRSGLVSAIREAVGMYGPIPDPHGAYLLGRGLKTLSLRVERHNHNGQALSEMLEAHAAVERVWYPGLASHPDHEVARKLLSGFGGVVSFTLRGGDPAATQVVDGVRIPKIAPSLGGVESLIEQPALMSHFDLSPEARAEIGIVPGLIRYAAGVEDTQDLVRDLSAALDAVQA